MLLKFQILYIICNQTLTSFMNAQNMLCAFNFKSFPSDKAHIHISNEQFRFFFSLYGKIYDNDSPLHVFTWRFLWPRGKFLMVLLGIFTFYLHFWGNWMQTAKIMFTHSQYLLRICLNSHSIWKNLLRFCFSTLQMKAKERSIKIVYKYLSQLHNCPQVYNLKFRSFYLQKIQKTLNSFQSYFATTHRRDI